MFSLLIYRLYLDCFLLFPPFIKINSLSHVQLKSETLQLMNYLFPPRFRARSQIGLVTRQRRIHLLVYSQRQSYFLFDCALGYIFQSENCSHKGEVILQRCSLRAMLVTLFYYAPCRKPKRSIAACSAAVGGVGFNNFSS